MTNKIDQLNVTIDSEPMTIYFAHDSRGNIQYNGYRAVNSVVYDECNLPLSMTANGLVVKYSYDDSPRRTGQGNRIYKEQNGQKEYYVRDQSGRELAIFSVHSGNMDSLRTVNLYGSSTIGSINVEQMPAVAIDPETEEEYRYTVRRDEPLYYLQDSATLDLQHLGSIKATIYTAGNAVFVEDTYPFGEIIRSYTLGGYDNRIIVSSHKDRRQRAR